MTLAFDPGIGFGKTLAHNLSLLKDLSRLHVHGRPLVIGVSRKSFLAKLPAPTARSPSAVAHGSVYFRAAMNGADVLRVHDVKKMWKRARRRRASECAMINRLISSYCSRLAQCLRDRAADGGNLLWLSLFPRGPWRESAYRSCDCLSRTDPDLDAPETRRHRLDHSQLLCLLAIALVVIFQPELRRALAKIGGHPIFSLSAREREMVHDLAEAVIQLSSKQFGALLAIERDTSIRVYEETGVQLEADFSVELLLTIFHPKTALHDGGVIIRNGRIAAAACISGQPSAKRSIAVGLRHRAGFGLTEIQGIAIVISEETGGISICHRRRIERDFTPETFRKRIGEILLQSSYDEETDSEKLAGENISLLLAEHTLVSDKRTWQRPHRRLRKQQFRGANALARGRIRCTWMLEAHPRLLRHSHATAGRVPKFRHRPIE